MAIWGPQRARSSCNAGNSQFRSRQPSLGEPWYIPSWYSLSPAPATGAIVGRTFSPTMAESVADALPFVVMREYGPALHPHGSNPARSAPHGSCDGRGLHREGREPLRTGSLASHRARMLAAGSPLTVQRDNDKNPVVALREIADGKLQPDDLKEISSIRCRNSSRSMSRKLMSCRALARSVPHRRRSR